LTRDLGRTFIFYFLLIRKTEIRSNISEIFTSRERAKFCSMSAFLLITSKILHYTTPMRLTDTLTDAAALQEIGRRLAKQRLAQSKSQEELAIECGLARRTIVNAETGNSVQSTSLVRMLRALGLLEVLDTLLPEHSIKPMDVLKLKKKERKRVSRNRGDQQGKKKGEWQWGDE